MKIRDEIKAITTPDQVRAYLAALGLPCTDIKTNKAVSGITVAEYKYIFRTVYGFPAPSNVRKDMLIEFLLSFFAGIDRAIALKP